MHFVTTVPMPSETHGGEDVPVYAIGVFSELFTGTYEQSFITWAMACAGGLAGPSDRTAKILSKLCPQNIYGLNNSAPCFMILPSSLFMSLISVVLVIRRFY